MPLILRCDAPGCLLESEAVWLPSGRVVVKDSRWWLLQGGGGLVVTCSHEHAMLARVVPDPKAEGTQT